MTPCFEPTGISSCGPSHPLDLRRSRPERTSLRKWLLKTLQSLQCRTVIQDRFFDGIVGLVAELLFGARKVAGETGIGIGHGILFFDQLEVRSWISFAHCRDNIIPAERDPITD